MCFIGTSIIASLHTTAISLHNIIVVVSFMYVFLLVIVVPFFHVVVLVPFLCVL
jgi:hypothetical protein